MTNDQNEGRRFAGEWLLAFSGVGLVSLLVTLFLLNDPYWKLASLDTPLDETSSAIADVFDADIPLDVDEPVAFAFAYDAVDAEAPTLPKIALMAVATPIADPGLSVPDLLEPVDRTSLFGLAGSAMHKDPSVLARGDETTSGLAASAVEEQLDLTPRQRAVLQRRLILAGHDPRGVDGIFGDETRLAITDFQEQKGLPGTGYFDTSAIVALTEETRDIYVKWKRARDQRAFIASVVPPEPRPVAEDTLAEAGSCSRDKNGAVVAYQSIVCDLTGLGESIWAEFSSKKKDRSRFAELSLDRDR
ncbi:MAG: peptidoglycan-binding domain-containing protein [Pseudomonadota bacterium]